ncbi:hypothetical protein RDWZM_000262 [Blomia tropicalis]|uniref:Protein kinase domain-containing protein n=1 Tax=Blomia tropicalis TaxID=40697 RepID=A0A9Q0MCH2_BLOTA|nr:hypothetical protein RDWZM_000262 [Blomia tropicalis]
MATEVISTRGIELHSNGTNDVDEDDVEMILDQVVVDDNNEVVDDPEKSDSSEQVVVDGVGVVGSANESNHDQVTSNAIVVPSSTVDVVMSDGSILSHNKESISSDNVHHHHHYHYIFHHHFHHQQSHQIDRISSSPTSSSSTTGPKLMIPSSTTSSTSNSGESSPVSPITPLPPTTPEIMMASMASTVNTNVPLLSSQNTSALVRTISNGSTFGPINPISWPLFGPKSTNQSTCSTLSTVESTCSNDSKQPRSINSSLSSSSVSYGRQTTGPILNSTTANSLQTSSSSASSSSSSSSPTQTSSQALVQQQPTNTTTTTTTAAVTSLPSIPIGLQSQPLPTTTTTIFTQTVSSNAILPSALELPLSFGDSYILTSQIEASNLYHCIDTIDMQEYCVKVVLSKNYMDFMAPHVRMDGYDGINQVKKIVVGRIHTFILFERSYGDLHSYVRTKRRLRETEAIPLFQQIVQIVADCHSNGIILRDLKLRKFIFTNKERTQLKLETLEGASLFENDDDTLSDKHGCPAYVSPEILFTNAYSGTMADCWSVGVILYTMLVGRYPFHDTSPSVVFTKIRRGTYNIPDSLTKHAKCLIRSLIRIDPEQRLTAEDALAHRWLRSANSSNPVRILAMLNRNRLPHHYHHHQPPEISNLFAQTNNSNGNLCCHNMTGNEDQVVPDLIRNDNNDNTEMSD